MPKIIITESSDLHKVRVGHNGRFIEIPVGVEVDVPAEFLNSLDPSSTNYAVVSAPAVRVPGLHRVSPPDLNADGIPGGSPKGLMSTASVGARRKRAQSKSKAERKKTK